ncbi:MAG TPA: stage II sporulation protein R [Syntrophomonas sp.]|jgi:stage II sporulation protein R|nr:stage II sporulation protein R [Syntrophomonas sp.]
MKKNFFTILLVLFAILLGSYAYMEYNQPLNRSVLRLHVVANSDLPADQALKLEIKDRIVTQMGKEFKDVDSAQEARRIAISKKAEIKELAETMVTSRGYDYPVEVYVGEFDFPTKSYGNLVFPQGRYEAVRIVLGEGEGKNWWCVLFPPLCMVSSSDKGLSLDSPAEAQVSLKCLELLPQGVKVKLSGK